jgi:hypothetical protein
LKVDKDADVVVLATRTFVNPLSAKLQDHRAEFTKFLEYFRELASLDPDGSGDASRKVDILTAFVDLVQRTKDAVLKDSNVDDLTLAYGLTQSCYRYCTLIRVVRLRVFVVDGHRGVRSAAYRAIRYIMVNESVIPLLKKHRLYVFMARHVFLHLCLFVVLFLTVRVQILGSR